MSRSEEIAQKILEQNNIKYYYNYKLKNVKVRGKNKTLIVDFFLPEYKIVLELDGEQHYTQIFNGFYKKHSLSNDFMKNAYCKKNNLLLLRIKYTDFDRIEEKIIKFFDKHFPI